jgi:hypothetical protein
MKSKKSQRQYWAMTEYDFIMVLATLGILDSPAFAQSFIHSFINLRKVSSFIIDS